MSHVTADPAVRPGWRALAIRYAVALHGAGATAPAIEDAVVSLLAARGVDATVMATPTALWVDVDGARVVRLRPAGSDLGRLAALSALDRRVRAEDGLPLHVVEAELDRIAASPGPWPRWLEQLAVSAVGGGVAVAMGGGAVDGMAAAVLAATVAGVDGAVRGHPRGQRLADGLAGFVAGAGAALLGATGADPARVALAAVTLMAPGLALTTAAEETASGHWTSGTARLAGGLVTLVQLAVGLALGAALVPALGGGGVTGPAWAGVAAHLLLAPVVAVLCRVPPRDLLPATAVGASAALASHLAPGPFGALLGAAAATVLGATIGRRTGAPPAIYASPALLMLVPGALGVAGLRTAIDGGPGTAWAVGAAVLAIVAGVFAGQALVGPSDETPVRAPV
ncbi:MAG: threonine/serine exporter family protein [Myxococcota bacterium]